MHSCCNIPCPCDKPSGYSRPRTIPICNTAPTKARAGDYKTDYRAMPNFKDFEGPHKDYDPPGCRTPAVGRKDFGDVPYLTSYQDPMYLEETHGGRADNLFFRGPFYKGVSETHSEYVNRGLPPPREYHSYTRHYEEPGMKDSRSVTQADYTPPRPMLPRDKAPCLKEDPPEPWHQPERNTPKNPHAKEVEARPQLTGTVYVDELDEEDLTTEYSDNYVAYQRPKRESKIKDPVPKSEEVFLRNMRGAHQKCAHPRVSEDPCGGSCRARPACPGPATPRSESWLLHPRDYRFRSGALLVPCKCSAGCECREGCPQLEACQSQ